MHVKPSHVLLFLLLFIFIFCMIFFLNHKFNAKIPSFHHLFFMFIQFYLGEFT